MVCKSSPKYIQLRQELEAILKSGSFQPGDRFYSNEELIKNYELSFSTVSRAMKELADAGLITRRRRGGTFVSQPTLNASATCPLLVCAENAGGLSDSGLYMTVSEVTRGITNHYDGSVKIVDPDEFLAELYVPGPKAAILVNPKEPACSEIRNRKIPYIYVCQARYYMPHHNAVSWDCSWGISQLADYLVRKLGHRRIAMFDTENPEKSFMFKMALSRYGISIEPEYLPKSNDASPESGRQLTKQLLSLPERPTAIFADTDSRAVGAMQAIKEAGLRIPDDISIVGFNDFADAAKMEPPLTTVRIPCYEMGREAVKMLNKKLSTGDDINNSCLPAALIIRDSCAPVSNI